MTRWLNRPWRLVALLAVTGILFGGLALAGEASLEDVGVEVGAGALIGAVIVLFKPRFMREVSETAAVVAADVVAESSYRPVSVDELRDIERALVLRRRSESEELASAAEIDVSVRAFCRMIEHALRQEWFADCVFVQLGSSEGCPILEMRQPTRSSESDIYSIKFTLFMINRLGDYVGQYLPHNDVELVWKSGQGEQVMMNWVLDAIDRYDLHDDDLSVEFVFRSILNSYRTMMSAKRAQRGSNERIRGKLIYRINDEWALTSFGLEGIDSPEFFEAHRNEHGEYHGVDVLEIECPSGHDPELWDEAQGACISLVLAASDLYVFDEF